MCRAGEDLSLCYGLFRTLIFTLTTYSRQAAQGTGGTGALSSRHRCSLTRFLLTVNTLTTRVPHGSSRVLINHRHEPQDRLSSTAKVGYCIHSPKSHSTHSIGGDAAAAKLQSARHKAFLWRSKVPSTDRLAPSAMSSVCAAAALRGAATRLGMGRRPETSRFGRASGAREERLCAFWHFGENIPHAKHASREIVPSFFCRRQNARIWEKSCNGRLAGSLCLWNVVACPPRGDWMEVRGRSAGGEYHAAAPPFFGRPGRLKPCYGFKY